MNLCKDCAHYEPVLFPDMDHEYSGSCNKMDEIAAPYHNNQTPINGVSINGRDIGGRYITVGPEFGCIHWE